MPAQARPAWRTLDHQTEHGLEVEKSLSTTSHLKGPSRWSLAAVAPCCVCGLVRVAVTLSRLPGACFDGAAFFPGSVRPGASPAILQAIEMLAFYKIPVRLEGAFV